MLPFDVVANQAVTVEETTPAAGVRVQGGDVIGVTANSTAVVYAASSVGSTIFGRPNVAVEGSTATFQGTEGVTLAVSAVLEPDVDRDGYGDETQDACPSDATRQVLPCVQPPTAPTCGLTPKQAKALKGGKLGAAKKAVTKAGCTVGTVTKPKSVPPGKVLRVVKVKVQGAAVTIKLKAVRKPQR